MHWLDANIVGNLRQGEQAMTKRMAGASIKSERGNGYRVMIESGEVVAAGITNKQHAQILAWFADEVSDLLAASEFGASGWCLRNTDQLRILQISPCAKFVLVERIGRSNGQWLNVGLFTTTAETVSGVWEFGWNGERVSHTNSAEALSAGHRETFHWVKGALRRMGDVDDEALRRCHRDSLSRALDHLCGERRQRLTELAALEAEIHHTEARLREYGGEKLEPAREDGGNVMSPDVTRH
jgi:hypothetical protein